MYFFSLAQFLYFCFHISMYTLLAAVTRSSATVQTGVRWLQKDLVRSLFKGHTVRSTAALPQQEFPSVNNNNTPSSSSTNVSPQKPDTEGEPFKPFVKNLFLGQFDKVRLFINECLKCLFIILCNTQHVSFPKERSLIRTTNFFFFFFY